MTMVATFNGVSYIFNKEDVYDCMRFFGCSVEDALYHLAYTEYSNSED